MATAWGRIGGWLTVGDERSRGRASPPGYGGQPRGVLGALGGFAALSVPRPGEVLGAELGRTGMWLVIGVGRGNVIKQGGLGKETGCISWVPLSRESRAWAELD